MLYQTPRLQFVGAAGGRILGLHSLGQNLHNDDLIGFYSSRSIMWF
jgi:hypothetical protein